MYLLLIFLCVGIDKTSSTELSEAINSMFKWYQRSAVCYAYLVDVHSKNDFTKSRWWNRGWTLQELIAPCSVVFFSSEWDCIGDKSILVSDISKRSRISVDVLLNPNEVSKSSGAQRMAWAANRKTTRSEDIAYCLLGIFDINMPLLYGEGRQAFKRLQEEIIRTKQDQSLLAWEYSPVSTTKHLNDMLFSFYLSNSYDSTNGNLSPSRVFSRTCFARKPDQFKDSLEVLPNTRSPKDSCSLNSNALDMTIPIVDRAAMGFKEYLQPVSAARLFTQRDRLKLVFGLLNCSPGSSKTHVVAMPMVTVEDNTFVRVAWEVEGLYTTTVSLPMHIAVHATEQRIRLLKAEYSATDSRSTRDYGELVVLNSFIGPEFRIVKAFPYATEIGPEFAMLELSWDRLDELKQVFVLHSKEWNRIIFALVKIGNPNPSDSSDKLERGTVWLQAITLPNGNDIKSSLHDFQPLNEKLYQPYVQSVSFLDGYECHYQATLEGKQLFDQFVWKLRIDSSLQ